MAITDPKIPPRQDLMVMCGGNMRLVKAFEALFKLFPSEIDKGSEDTFLSLLTADHAATQAVLANSEVANVMRLAEFSALSPTHAHALSDYLGISPAHETTKSDYIDVACQQIECSNFNLEI